MHVRELQQLYRQTNMKKAIKISIPFLFAIHSLSVSAIQTEQTDLNITEIDSQVTETTELDQIKAFCAKWLSENRNNFILLKNMQGNKTVVNYLEPYNQLEANMTDSYSHAQLYGAVHPDGEVRTYANNCAKDLMSLSNEISLSSEVYNSISEIDVSQANNETKRYHAKLIQIFELSGVDKDEATRNRIKELKNEIQVLGQEFNKNIREDVRYILLDSVDQLTGLPQDYIDSHPPGTDGKIKITTRYPDLFPFMTYAENKELRKELYLKYRSRAYPKNESVLQQLMQKRHELANLLGFNTFSEYITSDKMSGNPEKVQQLFDDITRLTKPRMEREYKKLLDYLKQSNPEIEKVFPWQGGYISNKIKTSELNFDSRQLRQYFSYTKVRDGIFDIVQRLFQVRIQPRDISTWHEDVEAYEMYNGDELIGRFYLDMHPRNGKYQHAAQFPYKTGLTGKQVPEAVLVCNFSKEGKALMQHGDVRTFFHEFGHLLHTMLSGKHKWAGLSGIKTEHDFVEAPSQMLEEWIWDETVLQSFATNESGEVIPSELIRKMNEAKSFKVGMDTMRQIYNGALSLNLHNQDPSSYTISELDKSLAERYSPYGAVEGTHFYANFGHLNGYSSMYYTYQWSKAIAMDMYTRFESEGLMNTQVAREYKDKVLSQGGAKPAAQLVEDFLGREFSFETYARKLSSSQN